jgi:hypothetical protein
VPVYTLRRCCTNSAYRTFTGDSIWSSMLGQGPGWSIGKNPKNGNIVSRAAKGVKNKMHRSRKTYAS